MKCEATGMGFDNTGYPGAFTPPIEAIIKSLITENTLHLFSGQSTIGKIRVDIEHPNATLKMNVKDFIKEETRDFDWVILDPPYAITRADVKLDGYGIKGCISSDVKFRRDLKYWLQRHASNVLWLDTCAPMIKGFHREKLWLVLPGGFYTVRVLSWLKRVSIPMELNV